MVVGIEICTSHVPVSETLENMIFVLTVLFHPMLSNTSPATQAAILNLH